jgi:hypothetical protein
LYTIGQLITARTLSFALVKWTLFASSDALKFAGESPGLCCLNGKVKLPLLTSPPVPLRSLLSGEAPESHFLGNTQHKNTMAVFK